MAVLVSPNSVSSTRATHVTIANPLASESTGDIRYVPRTPPATNRFFSHRLPLTPPPRREISLSHPSRPSTTRGLRPLIPPLGLGWLVDFHAVWLDSDVVRLCFTRPRTRYMDSDSSMSTRPPCQPSGVPRYLVGSPYLRTSFFFGLCVVILSLFLGVLESLHLYRLCIHLPRRDPNPVDLAPSNHSSIARPPLAESRSPRIVSKENDRRHG